MNKIEKLKAKADVIIDNIAYFVCKDQGTIEAVNLNNLKEIISFSFEECGTVTTTMTLDKAIIHINNFKKVWGW